MEHKERVIKVEQEEKARQEVIYNYMQEKKALREYMQAIARANNAATR